ncbi:MULTISPECIES: hypothetical protein [unclassified Bradyrhizobium]|uniref:hypothetical protein n=1 Tax=unclassified Bradyrhizobium TaxID=2631580 RepID=UPI0028E40775|nr:MULTISPECIES: hypothetical protein [unclassified Bradyrhizobium]
MSSINRMAKFARLIVMSGRAIFSCAIGGVLIACAAWLVLPDGGWWLIDLFAAHLSWKGFEAISLGLEPFANQASGPRGAASLRTTDALYESRRFGSREQGGAVPHRHLSRR